MIVAIDPGSEQSAFVIWDGIVVHRKDIVSNQELLGMLNRGPYGANERRIDAGLPKGNHLVIEQIRSYGMAVGAETFDTVFWSGRFAEAWEPRPWTMMPRMDVKMHLCHSARAKDTNIRQAVIDMCGKPGTVKEPNLVYGEEKGNKDSKIGSHMWPALALAITFMGNKTVNGR